MPMSPCRSGSAAIATGSTGRWTTALWSKPEIPREARTSRGLDQAALVMATISSMKRSAPSAPPCPLRGGQAAASKHH
jgi:hypothetical protein